MKRIREKLYIYIIMCILLLMFICTTCKIDTSMKLYGVTNEIEKPLCSFSSLMSGIWQSETDDYYKVNFPFRSWFVRVNNQFLYLIGGKINDVIIPGREGWLYSDEYVMSNFIEISEQNKTILQDYAKKVKKAQEKLNKQGKKLVYIITPNKVEIYPEHLPMRFYELSKKRGQIHNNYDYLKEQLTKNGVSFVDATMILKNDNKKIPMFCKTGIHWNYYAAALCASEVFGQINHGEAPTISVSRTQEPYGTQMDVYFLSNILFGEKDKDYYTVEMKYPEISSNEKKSVLEMGTSFSEELSEAFLENEICIWREYTRYQYFNLKTSYKGDKVIHESGDFYNDDLKNDIANADVIIIENNSSYVPDSHIKFVDYVLNLSDKEFKTNDFVALDKENLCMDFKLSGNAEEYILSGFYDAEDAGRWSKGNAELDFCIYATEDLHIDFSSNSFADKTKIFFNDKVVWKTQDGKEALKDIRIPVNEVLNGRFNYITIECDTVIQSPKQMGVGEDPRLLVHRWNNIIIYQKHD